jgi:hypothetical protein
MEYVEQAERGLTDVVELARVTVRNAVSQRRGQNRT